jgi:ribosomal-protein-alanine acetyltransferase
LPLRDATLADIEHLISLETLCFAGDRLSRRSFRRFLASPGASLRVARAGRAVLGYALILFRAGSGLARLYSIAVHPEARGSGVGTALLKDAAMTARKRGRGALVLEVRADNKGAIDLYRRTGFEPNGVRAAYYDDGAPALRFKKHLRGIAGTGLGKR